MGTKKKVLFLGASGLIGPHLTPGLADDYDLTLADVKPHPDGVDVNHVDITDYAQVRAAAEGMDAIMNFTVVRGDPDLSFHVSTRGAWHVMKAAAELSIGKIVHSGPESVRIHYDHDFDIGDPPPQPYVDMRREAIMQRVLAKETLRLAFGDMSVSLWQGGDNVHGEFGDAAS